MISDAEGLRAGLVAKLAAIDADVAVLTRPNEDAGSIQFGKRAGDATAAAAEHLARVATVEQLDAVRAEVVRAIAKVDEGTAGRCDGCGEPIAAARLEALPWAVRCVTCASGSPRAGRRR